MAINFISLTFGYVEEATVASLLLQNHSDELFIKTSEALQSLAVFFLEKWKDEHGYVLENKECCTKALAAKTKYCSECGKQTDLKKPFDIEDYQDWLHQQLNCTADSWGNYEGTWWPWGNLKEMVEDIKKGNCILQVTEKAEDWLIAALPLDAIPNYWQEHLKEWQKHFIRRNTSSRNQGLDLTGLINTDSTLLVIRG